MILFWILLLVVGLYIRTLSYYYVIDDCVKRSGYMYEVPLISPPPTFFQTKPSPWYRLFMIGMHCVNVSVIYLLWGWAPALLFAVHPLSVWGVAWVTGNYYATAAYFTLIAYYIIHTFPGIPGALVAMPIYAAALNSTVCPMTFPFIFLFVGQPWGLSMFIPLGYFLRGKKFQTGIKLRYGINNFKVIRDGSVKVNYFRRIAVMTRVVARYIYPCIWPKKLGFFDNYGRNLNQNPKVWSAFHSFSLSFWASFALCLVVFVGGMMIHPFGTLWFFAFAALHSQFNLTGQFYAQRYLYLSSIGLCIVMGTLLQPYPLIMAVVATALVIRTHRFIPVWRSQEYIWMNDVEMYPYCAQAWNNAAQYFLQVDQKKQEPHVLNKIAHFLFKAESIEPNSWEIQMNIACFFVRMGNFEEALTRTRKSLALLEPLGGLPQPAEQLRNQVITLQTWIKNKELGLWGKKEVKEETEGAIEGVKDGQAILSEPIPV